MNFHSYIGLVSIFIITSTSYAATELTTPQNAAAYNEILESVGGEKTFENAYRSWWLKVVPENKIPKAKQRVIRRVTRDSFIGFYDEFVVIEVDHYIASGQLMARTILVSTFSKDRNSYRLYEKTFVLECGSTAHYVNLVNIGRVKDQRSLLVDRPIVGIQETITAQGCAGSEETEETRLSLFDGSREYMKVLETQTSFYNRDKKSYIKSPIEFDDANWQRKMGRVYVCTSKLPSTGKKSLNDCGPVRWNKELTALVIQRGIPPWEW